MVACFRLAAIGAERCYRCTRDMKKRKSLSTRWNDLAGVYPDSRVHLFASSGYKNNAPDAQPVCQASSLRAMKLHQDLGSVTAILTFSTAGRCKSDIDGQYGLETAGHTLGSKSAEGKRRPHPGPDDLHTTWLDGAAIVFLKL